jgi:hypothetical protein
VGFAFCALSFSCFVCENRAEKRRSVEPLRASLLAIVGLVLASSSSAQVPAQTSGNIGENKNLEKQTATCTVSGQVITAADGTPLKSSRVVLMGQDAGSHPQAFSAATDGDGRFEIKNVAPGRYTFFATHSGYLTQEYQARRMFGGTAITLAPGQQVGDALFRLVRGAVVTGRVVDESGEPLAKIGVTALRKRSPEEMEDLSPRVSKDRLIWSFTAQSDDRGEYRIFDLMPGEYYVRASGSDFGLGSEDGMDWATRTSVGSQYAASFYPGVIQLDQAQTVVLSPGEEVRAEFAMRHVKTVEVSGRILAIDGSAARNASVMLIAPELGRWEQELSANTGATGEFTIKNVPPGEYALIAQQQDQDRPVFARQTLEVGNQNIDSIVLTFSPGTNIRGRIVSVGASLPERVQINLETTHESATPTSGGAQSKPDGSFLISGVSDGDYAVWIYDLEQGWYMRSARVGGEDVLEKGLQVEKGSSVGTLEITISPAAAQLEGVVTDHDKLAGGARVWARPEPETPYNRMLSKRTSTDQNGHYVFPTLAPGKYRVIAKLPAASSSEPAITSETKVITLGEREHQTLPLTLATPQSQ